MRAVALDILRERAFQVVRRAVFLGQHVGEQRLPRAEACGEEPCPASSGASAGGTTSAASTTPIAIPVEDSSLDPTHRDRPRLHGSLEDRGRRILDALRMPPPPPPRR